ncbi:hypothetical protein ACJIZ3_009511 [Penstemon smallii]|uniref:Ribosomal protein L32 n=1 Tax=Penstemon smallii TaxID=265156 RepID=A0ABD3TE70_9LAMI
MKRKYASESPLKKQKYLFFFFFFRVRRLLVSIDR